jgi:protoheme IX farnesyltransferase
MALAWMYRDDYARGGFIMLPSQDAQGQVTAQTCVLSSLMLVPVGLLATLTGISGYVYAAAALVLGLGMCWFAWKFLAQRTDQAARHLFLASLAYLPLLLGLMVADKGSVVPKDLRENQVMEIQLPEPTPAPVGVP